MANNIAYNGSDKWKIKATQLLNQGGGGGGSEGSSLSLDGRKFIFIGDSYQEGWTDSSGTVITIDSWLDYFISWYGSEFNGYYRNQAGGWGFAKANCQFITLLQALESTITDKADITDIVVEGGFNDHAYLSGIDSAILAFRNYARQTYPNATLWIAPVSRGINQFEADADAAHKIYIDSGMKYGFNICGEITRIMLNEDYYSTDLVHPTADGYKQICKYMHQCLTTGACDLLTGVAETSDLATVATSGSYNDLTNKPTIPAAQIQSDWTQSDTSSLDYIKNKPSIPSTASDVGAYTTGQVDILLADKQDSLTGGTISRGDLNTYTTIGHYYVNSTGASSVSHLPVALAGYLEVVQPSTTSGGERLQRYTAISGNDIVGVYERNFNSGSWQSWIRIDGNDLYLPLSGGTLTGDLKESAVNPHQYLNNTGFSVDSSANNGVTSAKSAYVDMTDNADAYTTRIYSEADTSGNINTRIQTRNMMEGTTTRRIATIRATVKKDGNTEFATGINAGEATYTIASSANFRSAIGIKDSPTILEPNITASQSVPTGTYKSLGSFELTTGTWLISYKAQFAAEDTGLRRIMLTSSSGSSSPWADSRISSHASHSGIIDIGWTTIVRITSSSVTRYLTAYQNSGSAVNVTGYVKAIKIINV